MREKSITILRHLEMAGICLLFFSLPFLKVPKNIGIVLFIVGAAGWRIADKSTRFRKPDLFEWMLLALFAAALISTVVNWPIPKGIRGAKDAFNYTLMAFFLYNSRYSTRQINSLLALITAGTFLALCWGLWRWQTGEQILFTFKHMSLGETAIITNIIVAALLGAILDSSSGIPIKYRFLAVIAASLFLVCSLWMGNRAGLLGFALFFILIALKYMTNRKFISVIAVISLTLLLAGSVFNTGNMKSRMHHLFETKVCIKSFSTDSLTANDRVRFEYWRVALAQTTQSGKFLTGIGPRNFRSIDIDKLDLTPPLAYAHIIRKPVHAHNLYLTKLCEEGIFGLTALVALWTFLFWKTLKQILSQRECHWSWIACLGAIVIPAVAGTFNSPFQREIAWTAMLFMGLGANQIRNRGRGAEESCEA